jgi:hypothetical protein
LLWFVGVGGFVCRQPPPARPPRPAPHPPPPPPPARPPRRVLRLPATDAGTAARLDADGGTELVEVVGPEVAGIRSPAGEPVRVEVPEPRSPS